MRTGLVTVLVTKVAIVLLLVTGCAQLQQGAKAVSSAVTGAPRRSAPPTRPAAAGRWVVCADETASYPQDDRAAALSQRAGDLETLAFPGSPGATVWVRKIGADSFSPSAGLLRFSVPAIPAMPRRPSRNDHPVDWPSTKRAYAHAVTEVAGRLRGVRAELAADAAQVRSLHVPVEYSSDIWGCISAASQLLSGGRGTRNLILVTDARPWGSQQQLPRLSLAGMRVTFGSYVCQQAVSCSRVMSMWARELSGLGAASVRFFRPEASFSFFGLSPPAAS